MIKVYGCSAPNPKKISIFLEEAEVPYEYVGLSLFENDNRSPEYLEINPNGRFPAIIDDDVDGEPLIIWESGAILVYLAEKYGKFLPTETRKRAETLKWLFWQVSHAPYIGNAHMYRIYVPEPREYEIKRFTNETARLYRLLEDHLEDREWMAADQFTIADITLFPWIQYHEWHGQQLEDSPNILRWFERMSARPGVARGKDIPYPVFQHPPSGKVDYDKLNTKIAARLADPRYALKPDPVA
ncbi:glutathione S-transferase family protein [Ruegeria sp.]|uniref:glutathione S-transferase family protein n=1 Tax=Ruegeria sp. TaxID=1879320 RepID=UPI003C7D289B